MGYRSHPRPGTASSFGALIEVTTNGIVFVKHREAAADPAFLNGDRPWVEISSFLNGRLFPSRAARERVVTQRSMIHRYATKIPVG